MVLSLNSFRAYRCHSEPEAKSLAVFPERSFAIAQDDKKVTFKLICREHPLVPQVLEPDLIELGVMAFLREQFGMGPLLQDPAVLQHNDQIRINDRR